MSRLMVYGWLWQRPRQNSNRFMHSNEMSFTTEIKKNIVEICSARYCGHAVPRRTLNYTNTENLATSTW